MTLACEDTFYVLRFSREDYVAALQAGEVDEDGVEAAFEVVTDVNERLVDFPYPPRMSSTDSMIPVSVLVNGSVTALSTPTALTV